MDPYSVSDAVSAGIRHIGIAVYSSGKVYESSVKDLILILLVLLLLHLLSANILTISEQGVRFWLPEWERSRKVRLCSRRDYMHQELIVTA